MNNNPQHSSKPDREVESVRQNKFKLREWMIIVLIAVLIVGFFVARSMSF